MARRTYICQHLRVGKVLLYKSVELVFESIHLPPFRWLLTDDAGRGQGNDERIRSLQSVQLIHSEPVRSLHQTESGEDPHTDSGQGHLLTIQWLLQTERIFSASFPFRHRSAE
jgi:hypothetical protein